MASLFVFEFWRALLPAKSKLRNNKQTSLKKRIFELLKNTRLLKGEEWHCNATSVVNQQIYSWTRGESDQEEKRKPFIFIRQLSEKLASSKTAVGSKEEEDLLLDYLSDV